MFLKDYNQKMKYLQLHAGVRVLVVLMLVAVIGAMCLNSTAYAGTVSLPQTGQVTIYATGDDGDLKKGVAWPYPRFTDNGDQTITDTLTGLVWTKDAGTPTVSSCTGGRIAWPAALDYVKCLNTAGYLKHTDWRLPNINELESLVNSQREDQSIWLNLQGVVNMQSYNYWSSTTYAYDTSLAATSCGKTPGRVILRCG
ncbi:MAG: DUF1566 domain-containing protein [Nitrospirae bacterium]|nr:DUF1566 domain-containing protein [Nitrospirota bacterium]